MAKIYDIKTGKEIVEASPVTARQIADRLSTFEELLREEGFDSAADKVRSARATIMPTVVRERRDARKAKMRAALN